MNLCRVDYAGVGIKLTEAMNLHTNHEARHLCMEPHHFQYPTDIVTKDSNQIRLWMRWADIVSCHVYPRPLGNFRPKHLIMIQHGSYFRNKTEKVKRSHKEWNVKKVLGTTPDLVKYGAAWLPTAIPADRYFKMRRSHGGKPIVCQAPSNPKKKNTAEIESILGGRDDLQLLICHHMPHEESLKKRAVADVFIDRFRLGLGVSGLEAAAMGIPVIACSGAEDEKYILGEIGYLPYYKATLKSLEAAVDEILSKQTVYKEYADRGRQYILNFHDYPVVARRYEVICLEILSGKT